MLATGTIKRERERLAEIRAALRDGRQLHRVRPGRLDGAALRISIACPADWLAVIDLCAERRGVSRSVVIRDAALAGLEVWYAEDVERAAAEPMLDDDANLGALPTGAPPED